MDTLALTDRDGTYGAVKFAQACRPAGIRPVLGVDLAYRPVAADARRSGRSRPRTPVRGGEFRDPTWDSLPRVTLLASAGGPGGGRAGWAAICRLVSAVHLAGERGRPVATLDLLAPWLADGRGHGAARAGLRGRARAGHPGAATTSPGPRWRRGARWCRPATSTSSWSPTGSAGPAPGAPASGVPAAPRTPPGWPGSPTARASARCSPTPSATPTAATPRPSTSSTPPAGWSPSTGATSTAATPRASSSPASRCSRSPRRSAGWPGSRARTGAHRLLARTRAVADRCALDPRADLGLGEVHFPELGRQRGARPTACCAPAARVRSATATAPRRASASGSASTTSSS